MNEICNRFQSIYHQPVVWKPVFRSGTYIPGPGVSIHLPPTGGLEDEPPVDWGRSRTSVSIHLPPTGGLEGDGSSRYGFGLSEFQSIYHQPVVWKGEGFRIAALDIAGFNPSTTNRWSGRSLFASRRFQRRRCFNPSTTNRWSGRRRSPDPPGRRRRFQSIYHQPVVWK